jgi:gamma-glutamyltranspeptidase/glutathione hydrolase
LDVGLEAGFDPDVATELERRGHRVQPAAGTYGGAQIILRTDSGYVAASDHRKDGHAAGF